MSTTFGPESAHIVALDRVLAGLERVERRIREAEAQRVALLAEAFDIAALESKRSIASTPQDRSSELAYRAVRAEVATTLHQSERTAERHMCHAVTLTRQYPRVFASYRQGLLSERHTTVITDAGAVIGGGESLDAVLRRAAYEEAVLEIAVAETPNRLQPLARQLAERFADIPLDERHAEARSRRRVYLVDGEDGMADLIAHLPAAEAHGIYQRLTRMSREIEQGEAEARRERREVVPRHEHRERAQDEDAPNRRTRDEVRADALSDLLLSGWPSGALAGEGLRRRLGSLDARVQLLLPIEALLARESRGEAPWAETDPLSLPPLLTGYGPIDTGSARQIAGDASHWEIARTCLSDGAVISVERYRPSEEMRRLLRARDQHCRFPGCRVPIARCDIDHTVDAALGGSTSTDNLAHLCRGHHTLKHHTAWRVRQRRSGTLEWTSPTGRRHLDRSEPRVTFTTTVRKDAEGPPGEPF